MKTRIELEALAMGFTPEAAAVIARASNERPKMNIARPVQTVGRPKTGVARPSGAIARPFQRIAR